MGHLLQQGIGEPRLTKQNRAGVGHSTQYDMETTIGIKQETEDIDTKNSESQEIYSGHGEWAPQLTPMERQGTITGIWPIVRHENRPDHTGDVDIQNHLQVKQKGYPNRWGAKIPVASQWNLDLLESMLREYEDKEVVEWIRYGWPIGRLPQLPDPKCSFSNHKGGTEYPEALRKYRDKELRKGAIMGPYNQLPFKDRVGISPLSTRPKKNTAERRVILDLSFPPGEAVNDGIDKDHYLGFDSKISFPKIDQFAIRIFQLGQGAMMFKVDLSRYFRQIPIDPGDYSLIDYVIDGQLFFDKVLPMGLRSAPYIAQRISDAITCIHRQMQLYLLNYVNDSEVKEHIWRGFNLLTQLLKDLGVEAAQEKVIPPTTRLEFLGVIFDAQQMTMEVTPDRLKEIKLELQTWLTRTKASRREVESLIDKLQFISKCVKVGRVFLARLIDWIRGMDRVHKYTIPQEARKDIAWWGRFVSEFNGTAILWLVNSPRTDEVIATDACKKGYAGRYKEQYYRARFPQHTQNLNIAIQEMLAVMVALKVWVSHLQGKYFWIHVDNEALATVINTGASREPYLQDLLREIALPAARNQFVVKARHISGVSNRIPDWLVTMAPA